MDSDRFIRFADRASMVYAASFFLTIVATTFLTDGVATGARGVVGGDFLAFYTAGEFALRGEAAAAYDFASFDAALKTRAPLEAIGMMWQYPPAMFFIAAPFALLPYKAAFIAWTLAGWAVLAWALRQIGFRGETFRILLFSSLTVSILGHGQISAMTAGLLFLAAYDPKRRWLVAGLAAGLLTIKPQLGLLLPFAFLAVGAWRTIAVACITAALLHAVSFLAVGADGWSAFFDAALRFKDEFAGAAALTPPRGMTTVFGQLKLMGVSGAAAMQAQVAALVVLAAMTIVIWRRSIDPLAKAAFIGAGAIIAAPYAYGYEMTALLLAGVVLARRAQTPRSALGTTLIALWLVIAARPLVGELAMLNTAFLIAVSVLATLTGAILRGDAIDRAPAHA